jgi:TP901-1 family phage major tail protein
MKINGINLQLFAVTLPDNPDVSKATVGKDYILYINIGTVETPDWAKVGGQRNSPLNQTADTIDVSHKGSGGYKSTLAGLKGWDISLDALAMLDDPGVDAIEHAYDNSKQVNIKLERPDLKYKTGWASVTEYSLEPPHDGEATISASLEGVGPISPWTAPVNPVTITPLTATFSKAAAADKVFTVSPSTATITSVSNAASALTITTDYTYSAGTLTLKSAYLNGLTNGSKIITVTPGTGSAINLTVEIGA